MITENAEKIIEKEKTTIRPPIVVVLGHVNHGKSSLLEAIREDFRIVAKESGGITQHIGAYEVEHEGKKITFIDTPGHELFSEMRSRGAKIADIAVLVVAAEESVKPQTIEAIKQITKAQIPMVVAINKIDKAEANPERVKQELAQHEVVVESFGGEVPSVETSAVTKQGIKDLLEMILLMAELEDLKVEQEKIGEGVIIESYLDAKRGPTATLLVTNGRVRVGDWIGTKSANGKVRTLEDFQSQAIREAVPCMPSVVLGFIKAPKVGEEFRIFEDDQSSHDFLAEEKPKAREAQVITLDPETNVHNIVLKADVAGSLEVLEDVFSNFPSPEEKHAVLRLVVSGVGEVGENDVKLARLSKAHIFAFRTKVSAVAVDLAQKEDVPIENFEVIYELIQRARELMEESAQEEGGREDIGSLNVLAIFLTDKKKQVVGGKVTEGEVRKGVKAEIIRDEEVVGEGKITNVQHEKKDVPSVSKGQECGLSFEGAEKIQEGDRLQFFTV